MAGFLSKYSFELWTPGGQLIADLGGRARNRSVVMSRNEAEQINFMLNLDEFEQYCRDIQLPPSSILKAGSTEVRVKRQDKYLCGGQITYAYPHLNAEEQTYEIRATGFLNMFDARRTGTSPGGNVTEEFIATESTTIAVTLINETQSLTNGDYGVTIGSQATVGIRDKTYSGTNIKSALQALTQLESRVFDFEFTHDKIFKTYTAIGSNKPEIAFEYPGNIIDIGAPVDATKIENEILALGQGGGQYATAFAYAVDLASQTEYRLRQKTLVSNGVDDSDNGITDAADAEKAAFSFPFQVPALLIDGNVAPFITDYGIGDYILVQVKGYDTFANVNGMYRIEKIGLNIDNDDNEQIVLEVTA